MGLAGNLGYLYRYYKRRTSKDYLTSDWSEEKYNAYYRNRAFLPFYSAMADRTLGMIDNEQYFNRYDMTWDDVTRPDNLPGSGRIGNYYTAMVQVAKSGINYVSHNLNSLYKDDTRQRISDAYNRGYRNSNNYLKGYMRGRS